MKKKFLHFFPSTHQVGMKNVVKCYKDFFGYFIALKTHCEYDLYNDKLKVRTLALALVSISADTKGTIILDGSISTFQMPAPILML